MGNFPVPTSGGLGLQNLNRTRKQSNTFNVRPSLRQSAKNPCLYHLRVCTERSLTSRPWSDPEQARETIPGSLKIDSRSAMAWYSVERYAEAIRHPH